MGILEWFGLGGEKARGDAMSDPNMGASMQFYTPGQPVYTPKNYGSFVREGYRKNPTVYACINKISSAAAGIRWKLYTDKSMEREIETHPLLDLWNAPNPNLRGSGPLVESVFGFWHMSGNSYLWAFRPNPNSPPLALWPLRPDRMKAVVGDAGIENYVYGYGSNNPQIYEVADMMHLKFPSYDDDVYGLSPIEVASYYVDQINESMAWNTSLMQNMGRPASVFFSKGYLTTEQRNQVREELRRKYSGKRNAGMPLVLEADMSWQNMSLKPAELDWLESREHNTRDISSIFDIASELIGDSKNKTYSNMKEARQALYLENVLPKLDRARDYLNSWLVPMYSDLFGAYFTYDKYDIEELAEIYQAAAKAVADEALQMWNEGGITLNEYRKMVGKEKIDGGDCLKYGAVLVSVDSLSEYADQSLQAPAAPPAALAEPLNVTPEDPQQAKLADLLLTMFNAYLEEKKRHDLFNKPTVSEEASESDPLPDAKRWQDTTILLQTGQDHLPRLESPQPVTNYKQFIDRYE